jgi:hypothetical protein
MWQAQVLTAIRDSHLMGHLTGATSTPTVEVATMVNGKESKTSNPDYNDWYAMDQQVLGFFLSSLSREIMAQVTTKPTAATTWAALEAMSSSQTKGRALNTRLALATTQKGSQSIAEYFRKMRALGDEMATAGRTLEDDELFEYKLTGFDNDFNSIVSA